MIKNSGETFSIKVNEFEFSFTREEIEAIDLIKKTPTEYHLLKDHQSIKAQILDSNSTAKEQLIELNGENFTVVIKDELDQMLDKLGFSAVAGKQIKEIKAPMPGLVLEINVTEGQLVKEGDKILILVAMKMENSILIQADATIKKIAVKPGQAVDKGQMLVELE